MAVPRIDVVVNVASRSTPRAAITNISAPVHPSHGILLITNLPAARLSRLPRSTTLPTAATNLLSPLLPTLLSSLPTLTALPLLRALALLSTLPLALSLLPALTLLPSLLPRLLYSLALLSALSLLPTLTLLPPLSRLSVLPLLTATALLLPVPASFLP